MREESDAIFILKMEIADKILQFALLLLRLHIFRAVQDHSKTEGEDYTLITTNACSPP